MPASSATIRRRSFEALFGLRRPPGPRAAAELERIGYPHSQQDEYPLADWRRVLAAVTEDWFPGRPRGEALRELGRLHVRGFAETTVGAVLSAAARAIGTERTILRIPGYLKVGRGGPEPTIGLSAVGTNHWRLRWRDDAPVPEFIAGSLEELISLTGSDGQVVLHRIDADCFELDLSWKPKAG